MAVGVAKPRAQGQAISNTVIALLKAKLKGAPATVQEAKVKADTAITLGTNIAEILSTNFPQTATLLKDGQEMTISIDDIELDDLLLIRPGEKIPTEYRGDFIN
jgi:magnesium-transporting ATPase (P-type)